MLKVLEALKWAKGCKATSGSAVPPCSLCTDTFSSSTCAPRLDAWSSSHRPEGSPHLRRERLVRTGMRCLGP